MDKYPISASSLEKFYYVDGHLLERQYREHLSGYFSWEALPHADEWLVFPENVGPNMSIDETALSDGELYTVLTNKDARGGKGALAAIVAGTKAEVVRAALDNIPGDRRDMVREITMDLSYSMKNIAVMEFRNAKRTIDRFHVQKLALEAIQEMRVGHRWEALRAEHERRLWTRTTGEVVPPEIFPNGDTRPQLLARSRYLLFKSAEKWTDSQKTRAGILFGQYPDLEEAYWLTHRLRMIYANTDRRPLANTRLAKWYLDVENSGFDSFKVIAATLRDRETEIVNFFDNRATNASAESFNCKIKTFRAQLRGVSDIKYFLYRLSKIYA